jgi:Clp amino terminal domain, pathogenicity island component
VFERFTDRARHVVVLAQEEARLLNHNYIGTEHILLGLIHEGEGIAAKALESLEISLDDARAQVHEIIGHGGQPPSGHIPFTPRAKKVLELSLREALQLGHNYIGTEHILLGLIREGEGVAAQVLANLGADLATVRQRVIQLLSGHTGGEPAGGTATGVESPLEVRRHVGGAIGGPPAPSCSFCGRDLWEVGHYVTGNAAIMCEVCIVAAHLALEAAPDDTDLLALPPRVFGNQPADDPGAVAGIVHALTVVFGPALDDEAVELLEDGEQLVPIMLEFGARFRDLRVSAVVVERVRFTTATAASVGFVLVLNTGARFSFIGTVVRSGERWIVARTTVADVIGRGGGLLPPA